jgi:hypothetical protein
MLTKPEDPEKNEEPPLKERELTDADVGAIELAISTKRPIGWVHAVAMARRIQELEAEVEELRSHGLAGKHKRGKGW